LSILCFALHFAFDLAASFLGLTGIYFGIGVLYRTSLPAVTTVWHWRVKFFGFIPEFVLDLAIWPGSRSKLKRLWVKLFNSALP
jgi:hypothetical protein